MRQVAAVPNVKINIHYPLTKVNAVLIKHIVMMTSMIITAIVPNVKVAIKKQVAIVAV